MRSKKHLKNEKQNELIIPEWLFREPIENKIKKIYNHKPLKQIARDSTKLDDKQFNKELAQKMINPYYFTDRNLKIGFKIILNAHHINHANSKLTIPPNCPEFGIQVRYINEVVKELSASYARLMNQYKFKYQAVFSARFDKQEEDDQVLDETELFNNLNINHNLTKSDLDNIDIRSPLEPQIQQQEVKELGDSKSLIL